MILAIRPRRPRLFSALDLPVLVAACWTNQPEPGPALALCTAVKLNPQDPQAGSNLCLAQLDQGAREWREHIDLVFAGSRERWRLKLSADLQASIADGIAPQARLGAPAGEGEGLVAGLKPV